MCVSLAIDRDFKLENLIDLNLHKFADDVQGIVDRAVKELSMEKFLRDVLDKSWQGLMFEFGTHSSGIPLLIAREEVTELLDDHQVPFPCVCFAVS